MFQSVDQKNIDILLNDGARISKKIHFLKKPVIMQIQGPAVGTGTIMTLLADVRIVANKKDIFFQLPELIIGPGIFPATGPTVGAVKLLGNARAKDMLFTGRRVSLAEFNSWGVVNKIVDSPEDLPNVVKNYAKELSRKSLELLALTKNAINTMSTRLANEFYNLENDYAEYYFDGLKGEPRIELDEFLKNMTKKYAMLK
jgi:enoyl-CoA hydratase/carnithine racemase